jgi:transglycosylase-like protein with SLT domain
MGIVISWAAVQNVVTGVPLDEPDRRVAPGPSPPPQPSPYWGRLVAEMSHRPVRLIVACLATVLGPAVVAHAGNLTAPIPVASAARAGGPAAAAPQPGDATTWLAAARKVAETCPGLPPPVLVSIGEVETGLGTLEATSTAGARGPMQFLPATWAAYGTDGDGDGIVDVMDPSDAMAGAAQLLCANGGADPDRLPSAIWNYNHSDAYVSRVLAQANLLPAAA